MSISYSEAYDHGDQFSLPSSVPSNSKAQAEEGNQEITISWPEQNPRYGIDDIEGKTEIEADALRNTRSRDQRPWSLRTGMDLANLLPAQNPLYGIDEAGIEPDIKLEDETDRQSADHELNAVTKGQEIANLPPTQNLYYKI